MQLLKRQPGWDYFCSEITRTKWKGSGYGYPHLPNIVTWISIIQKTRIFLQTGWQTSPFLQKSLTLIKVRQRCSSLIGDQRLDRQTDYFTSKESARADDDYDDDTSNACRAPSKWVRGVQCKQLCYSYYENSTIDIAILQSRRMILLRMLDISF